MPASIEEQKDRLFAELDEVYEELGKLCSLHQQTSFGCQQSGNCCKVGLELHFMECERIARGLRAEAAAEPARLPIRVAALKRALDDPAWTAAKGFGDNWCAFFVNGCTIYGFRPAVCRMYGPLLPVDEECPRERIAGRPHVYFGPDTDALVRRFYTLVDRYGKLTGRDRSIYMPAGVLSFLLPKPEIRALKKKTAPKFWRTGPSYRTQFLPAKSRARDLRKLEAAASAPP